MCGIAGYSTLGTDQPVEPAALNTMVSRLNHRGPDERGTLIFPKLAFGCARLSINDLAHGRQPIANEDSSIAVVCNGEIYNAPALREKLISKGHTFRTRSDIEVIVHLYEDEGEAFLPLLNGMFALALYDHKRERLIVARDRFGVKPLYYMNRGSEFIFASEIKALKSHPSFDSALDPTGLAVFLGLFYIPDPWTAYRHVHKLQPGHYIRIERDGPSEHVFHDLDYTKKIDPDRTEAEKKTVELLGRSVERQLLSDVSVGVLLSGGLDSRTISYLAHRHVSNLSSFTITFAEEGFNEGEPANAWARLLGADHRPMPFSADHFCDDYLERQRNLDEPYGLWNNVASARMGAAIHRAGYKVVLGGDGGDELFVGYPTIHASRWGRFYRMVPDPVKQGVIAPMIQALPAGAGGLPLAFMMKSFIDADDADPIRMFFGFKEVIRFKEWPNLLTSEAMSMVGAVDPAIAFDQYRSKIAGLHPVDGLSYLDAKVFLPGCCLTGIDNAYMENSVEVRVPFLDNDVAEFSCSLSPKLRYNPFKTKPMLRAALREHLLDDDETDLRREIGHYRKAGFWVPAKEWLNTPRFRDLVEDVLSPARIKQTGFFQPHAVRRILLEQLDGKRNNERMLQAIMSLVLFLDRH
ncbi:asparagine synthase (glutamine-hydrolyzing) [Alphaproteobacteria bacterium]|nr:asparagine synthase (glutamine-hydrolyzing) [Alphaproteobacteria bacterium]